MKSIQEIQTDYGNGNYTATTPYPKRIIHPHDGVIDEEKSVKWNREEVEKLKTEHTKACLAWRRENSEKEDQLRQDVQCSIAKDYNFSPKQAQLVEGLLWENYHSTMSDYFGHIEETAERIKEILDAKN